MRRKPLVLTVFFAAIGLGLPFIKFPEVRVIAVLLPFTFGAAAGMSLGRWVGSAAGPRSAA
jgi:hypothetical protein